jgi:hypothetical protein
MNIFWLAKSPGKIAEYHCDKHVVKMPLEMTQMLSTVHHRYDADGPYKSVHEKHPCTLWVGQTIENYILAWRVGAALFKEYKYRYDKVHKSEPILYSLRCPPIGLTARGITKKPQCMPEVYKHFNPEQAYRSYYLGEKMYMAKWTKRNQPYWSIE